MILQKFSIIEFRTVIYLKANSTTVSSKKYLSTAVSIIYYLTILALYRVALSTFINML